MVSIGGNEIVYNGVMIFSGDQSADMYLSYGGKIRKFLLQFSANWNGPAGVWVHNHREHKYTSILFAKYGSSGDTEVILDPPLRFSDLDGQKFELTVAHRKIGNAHRAAIQIIAIPTKYGGIYTAPMYGSDQPADLKIV